MNNFKKGFASSLLIIIAGLVLVTGSALVYSNKLGFQKTSSYFKNKDAIAITNEKDIVDYDTCISYAENIPTKFDIVFNNGSDIQDIRSFAQDFKTKYTKAELNVITEQDALDEAVAYNRKSLKTPGAIEEYKKNIVKDLTSKIVVSIPAQYLGTKKSFESFISTTLNKYPKIKFKQYAGSSPENFLFNSRKAVGEAQEVYILQCEYRFKKLSATERAKYDLVNADEYIKLGVRMSTLSASDYYEEHMSYGSGSLSSNNGICSDTGVYGLAKSLKYLSTKSDAVYCYASAKEFAVSAALKSDPNKGYCADSTGFSGESYPDASSKGYCVQKKKVSQDISSCKNSGKTVKERWTCVGSIVESLPPYHISNVVLPYATPVPQKIDFCKKFNGIEADYCFASIAQSQGTSFQERAKVCGMISNTNPWFKTDCEDK